jgi:hypothetical protein
MAKNFLRADRDQVFLMPPDMREWLPEDLFAHFVVDAVNELDLSQFYDAYRDDGWGRAAFEPSMMVALPFFALPRKYRTYVHRHKPWSEVAEGVGLEPTSPCGQRFSRPSACQLA